MIWGSPILRNLRIATLRFHVKFRVVTSNQSSSIDSATSIISHIVNEQCTTLDDHGFTQGHGETLLFAHYVQILLGRDSCTPKLISLYVVKLQSQLII